MKTLDVGVTVSATFTFLAGLTFTEYSIKEKTFNESCSGNEQCKPTLFCISGICNCASNEHWNGNSCIEGKKCDSTSDCNNTQTCISGVCQCTTLQYWTGTICAASLFPKVEAILESEEIVVTTTESYLGSSLNSAFRCNFENLGETVIYDLDWYINNDLIKSHENVSFLDLERTNLHEDDWVDTYNMNMKVKCSAGYRMNHNENNSKLFNSSDFEAGVIPSNFEYWVTEGKQINIPLTSTVPVGCTGSSDSEQLHCSENLYISMPEHTEDKCTFYNDLKSGDIMFKSDFCGVQINSLQWKKTNNLTIYAYHDGRYNNGARSVSIRVSKQLGGAIRNIWSNIVIPDIKVRVFDGDTSLAWRQCQSSNDPHIRTFDGTRYDYMGVGEFIMYRNDKGPFWVHALFTNCIDGRKGASCHCGIAVRSRNSFFVFRTCKHISRKHRFDLIHPYIELKTCNEEDMSITQYSRKHYKIMLPTGTEIQFKVSIWFKNLISTITIKPSTFDIDSTEGLCGSFNRYMNPNDDFRDRYSGNIVQLETFAGSWRVKKTETNEQLFVKSPQLLNDPVSPVQSEYCSCKDEAEISDDFGTFYSRHCNLQEIGEVCPPTQTKSRQFYTTCPNYSRKKRSFQRTERSVSDTNDADDIIDFEPLTYDDDVEDYIVESSEFTDEWTEQRARDFCTKNISDSIHVDLMEEHTGLDVQWYIDTCVEDIKLTGETLFVSDTIDAANVYTQMELLRNDSLTSDDSGNPDSLFQYVITSMCQNNCSGNGVCENGKCNCTNGFTDFDCSQSISIPPTGISLPGKGLCGIKTRQCKNTNIVGEFLSSTFWCKMDHFYITEYGKRYTGQETIVEGEWRNAYLSSCSLESSRSKRSTLDYDSLAEGFDIRLSNDGTHFGDSVTLIIYDEECYSCNSSTDKCDYLDACLESNSRSPVPIIGAVVGSFFGILVVVTILICCKYKPLKSRKEIPKINPQVSTFEPSCFSDTVDSTRQQKPPLETKLLRESSRFSIDWTDKACTPVQLFQIKEN